MTSYAPGTYGTDLMSDESLASSLAETVRPVVEQWRPLALDPGVVVAELERIGLALGCSPEDWPRSQLAVVLTRLEETGSSQLLSGRIRKALVVLIGHVLDRPEALSSPLMHQILTAWAHAQNGPESELDQPDTWLAPLRAQIEAVVKQLQDQVRLNVWHKSMTHQWRTTLRVIEPVSTLVLNCHLHALIDGWVGEVVRAALSRRLPCPWSWIPSLIRLFPGVSRSMFTILLESGPNALEPHVLAIALEILCWLPHSIFTEYGHALGDGFWDDIFGRVLHGLHHPEHTTQKRAFYLLKRSIEHLSVDSHQRLDRGIIHLSDLENQQSMWKSYFLILECVDEKQAHIVRQILDKATQLGGYVGNEVTIETPLHLAWILVILERLLTHRNQILVRWTISFFLVDFRPRGVSINHPDMARFYLQIFLPALNSTKLIHDAMTSSDPDNILGAWETFLTFFSSMEADDTWDGLIAPFTNVHWAPIPLLYLSLGAWKVLRDGRQEVRLKQDTSDKMLVLIIEKIRNHEPIYKGAVQEVVLRMIMKTTTCSELILDQLADLLGSKSILIPDTPLWCEMTLWVKHSKLMALDENQLHSLLLQAKSIVAPQEKLVFWKRVALRLRFWEGHLEIFHSQVFFCLLNLVRDHKDRTYSTMTSDLMILLGWLIQTPKLRDEGRREILFFGAEQPDSQIIPFFRKTIADNSDLVSIIIESMERVLYSGSTLPSEELLKHLTEVLWALPSQSDSLTDFFHRKLTETQSDFATSHQEWTRSQVVTLHLLASLITGASDIVAPQSLQFLAKMLETHQFPWNNLLSRRSTLATGLAESEINSYAELMLSNQWIVLGYLAKTRCINIGDQDLLNHLAHLALDAIPLSGRFGFPVVYQAFNEIIDASLFTGKILPEPSVLQGIIRLGLKTCTDFRRNETFWPCVKAFVGLTFSDALLSVEAVLDIQQEVSEFVFDESECVPALGAILALRLAQGTETLSKTDQVPWGLLHGCLVRMILFGTSYKKEQQTQSEVTLDMQMNSFREFNVLLMEGSDSHVPSMVRRLAATMILDLGSRMNLEDLVDQLRRAEHKIVGIKPRYFANSQVHIIKLRVLQAILLMSDVMPEHLGLKIGNELIASILSDHFQPSIRYLSEWIVIRLLQRFRTLEESLLEAFEEGKSDGSNCLPSLIYLISQGSRLSSREKLRFMLPWTMSQNFATRLTAQLIVKRIYSQSSIEIQNEFAIMKECVDESMAFGNMGKKSTQVEDDFYYTRFDPETSYNWKDIFYNFPRLCSIPKMEWIWIPSCSPKKSSLPKLFTTQSCLDEIDSPPGQTAPVQSGELANGISDSDVVQRKITPWQTMLQGEQVNDETLCPAHPNLVLVASLVDRVPNLGGLCRTSEILGVGEYVISTKKYLQDKDFTSLSVSSHHWVPITEIPTSRISSFLREKKSQGYQVIGVEQTSNSVSLNGFTFPEKTVLVMGHEREGIPVDLIHEMDVCLEIPQYGQIRSFNVHVTGAIVLWEYVKQQSSRNE